MQRPWRTTLWWIAVLFAIGSTCFLLAALASMLASTPRAGIGIVRVWAPDMIGSACFLVASELAFANGACAWLSFQPSSRAWWVNAVNLLGSIAFGVAALASLVDPSTAAPVSATVANAGTAAGALGFLIGALLLLPDARRRPAAAT